MLAYLLLMQPHVVGKAMVLDFTATRVVCWNTLNAALGSSLKGSASAFRMPHMQVFDDAMKAKAEMALGLATAQFEELHEAADFLARTQIAASADQTAEEKVVEFFDNVVSFDRAKAEREEREEKRIVGKFRHAFEHGPGANLKSAKGTWWGAVNAVTYVVDHHNGMTDETRVKSAWTGEGRLLKQKALDTALEFARAA
jgi:phage/plasmid-like protein (TIGR03299 family)